MSCITRDTGTVGTSSRHVVDEAKSESKTKRSSTSLGYLQDYMDAIIHEPIKWEDLEHCHMTHVLGRGFGTYLDQHAKNKNLGEIPWGKQKLQKQVMRVGKRLGMILFCYYIHQKRISRSTRKK